MSKAKQNTLLQACFSKLATESEKQQLSYAAGMWAACEHKITKDELRLAEDIILRNGGDEASAEYSIEPANLQIYGIKKIVMTITSGQNLGRRFLIQETQNGIVCGQRTFKSLAAAAAAFAKQ